MNSKISVVSAPDFELEHGAEPQPLGTMGSFPEEHVDRNLFKELVLGELEKNSVPVLETMTLEAAVDLMFDSFIPTRAKMIENGLTVQDREAAFFCTVISLGVENLLLKVKQLVAQGVDEQQALQQVLQKQASE